MKFCVLRNIWNILKEWWNVFHSFQSKQCFETHVATMSQAHDLKKVQRNDQLGRKGIIAYECTSHSFNIKVEVSMQLRGCYF